MAHNGNGSTTTTTARHISSPGDCPQPQSIKLNKLLSGDSGNDSLITQDSSISSSSATGDDLHDVEIDTESSASTTECFQTTPSAAQAPATAGESQEEEGAVNSIFLCEFHAIEGPRITLQVPNEHVTKDLFKIVHQYIIPKVPLQGSFLSISMFNKKILGYPIRLQSESGRESYARNYFYFNLCFVFRPTTRTICYEPIVKKLTEHMISWERSEKVLSQIKIPENEERLRKLLNRVRDDINRDKMCMLREGYTTVPLCVVSHFKDNIAIGAHQAPVLIENFTRFKMDQWDLTTKRILTFINGFNHIMRISQLAHMDLDLVKECVKHLVALDVCLLVPVFQYNNMYRPTPKLSLLAKCKQMQDRCIAKCSLKQRKCTVRDVFSMFANMAHGASFGEICVRFNPASLNINDRQMVLFGLVEGLIRIVNKYPVSVTRNLFVNTNCFAPTEDDDDSVGGVGGGGVGGEKPPNIFNSFGGQDEIYPYSLISNELTSKPIPRSGPELTKQRNLIQILKKFSNYCGGEEGEKTSQQILYTGKKSFDELSCAIGFSNHQLDDLLSRDKHCIVLFK